MTDQGSLLTTAEAAARAGVSARVVRDAIARGELAAERGRARSWVIRADALDAWLAARAGGGARAAAAGARASGQAQARGPAATHSPDAILISDDRPFVLHHGFDGWLDVRDIHSQPDGGGGHVVPLEPDYLRGRREVNFTRYYPEENRWEGQDHALMLNG